jgi:hypothetical protein
MPLSCFLCGQLLRAGARKHTLTATLLAPIGTAVQRGVWRRKAVDVCSDCFLEIEPDTADEGNER